MDKIKEKLHIGSRRKSQPENDFASSTHNTHTTGRTIEDNYGAYSESFLFSIHAAPHINDTFCCHLQLHLHLDLHLNTITWPC